VLSTFAGRGTEKGRREGGREGEREGARSSRWLWLSTNTSSGRKETKERKRGSEGGNEARRREGGREGGGGTYLGPCPSLAKAASLRASSWAWVLA